MIVYIKLTGYIGGEGMSVTAVYDSEQGAKGSNEYSSLHSHNEDGYWYREIFEDGIPVEYERIERWEVQSVTPPQAR